MHRDADPRGGPHRASCRVVLAAAFTALVVLGLTGCGSDRAGSTGQVPATTEVLEIPPVELSAACDSALEPARAYIDSYDGRFNEAIRRELNELIRPAYAYCDYDEYTWFVNTTVVPWARSRS